MANALAAAGCDIDAMIHTTPSSKVLLVGAPRIAATESAPVLRRFRIARLRVDGRRSRSACAPR
jgi:hypothetical protein